MKVRNIIHGARERVQRAWSRRQRRRAHALVRRERAGFSRMTLSLALVFTAQLRHQKRFLRYSRTPAYRRRVDRILFKARVTGGRIIHDSRSPFGRVEPRKKAV